MNPSDPNAFQALHQKIGAEPELQSRLFALTDPNDFCRSVQALAQSLGYALDEAEVLAAIRNGRRAWYERMLP